MSKDIIKLSIPAKSEYMSVVRLAIAGLSSNLGFNINHIEDLKVAVAEACINVVQNSNKDDIELEFEVREDCIYTRVKDVKEPTKNDEKNLEGSNLSILIIESLTDEMKFTDWGIEMVKFVGDDSNDNR